MDVGYDGRASAPIVAMRAVPRTGGEERSGGSGISHFTSLVSQTPYFYMRE